MKTIYLLTIIPGLLLFICSCKKENSGQNALIVGKWYETKLDITQQTIGTDATVKASYSGTDFSTEDYFQFNKDSTAVASFDGTVFTVTGMSRPVTANVNAGDQLYYRSYKVVGSSLILQVGFIPVCNGCSQPGPITDSILTLNNNSLVLRAVDASGIVKTTTDTYYSKAN